MTDFAALKPKVRGPVIVPGEPGYDDSRTVWNAMIDRRPAAVLRCLGVGDVVAGLAFAREQKLTVAIKGGGHNIAGLAVADGALLLDMSLMRGVWVDPVARVARVQAGCLLGDIDRETQLHGLAATLGFVSATGVAGLTLGGGFGYLSRRFGWTTDTLRSVEMVTADGRLVRASEKENADLFWGLRGGGGNFGVATGFELELQPVGPEIVGGAIAWPGARTQEVLDVYRSMSASAPPELALVAAVRRAPPAPWIAKEHHGQPIVAMFVCYTGPVGDADKVLKPMKDLGSPAGDIVQRRPYTSQQSLLDGTQPKGRRYYWKSEYVNTISAGLVKGVMEHGAKITSPHSAILLFPLGGAITKKATDHSPVGNRDATAVFNVSASWEKPEDDAAQIEWARNGWRDLRQFSTGGTYLNFLNEEEGGDRLKAAWGANYARLQDVKKKWDPENVFRANKNIG